MAVTGTPGFQLCVPLSKLNTFITIAYSINLSCFLFTCFVSEEGPHSVVTTSQETAVIILPQALKDYKEEPSHSTNNIVLHLIPLKIHYSLIQYIQTTVSLILLFTSPLHLIFPTPTFRKEQVYKKQQLTMTKPYNKMRQKCLH